MSKFSYSYFNTASDFTFYRLYAHLRTAHVDEENLQKAKNELEMNSLPVGNEELIETSGENQAPESDKLFPSEPITF